MQYKRYKFYIAFNKNINKYKTIKDINIKNIKYKYKKYEIY